MYVTSMVTRTVIPMRGPMWRQEANQSLRPAMPLTVCVRTGPTGNGLTVHGGSTGGMMRKWPLNSVGRSKQTGLSCIQGRTSPTITGGSRWRLLFLMEAVWNGNLKRAGFPTRSHSRLKGLAGWNWRNWLKLMIRHHSRRLPRWRCMERISADRY